MSSRKAPYCVECVEARTSVASMASRLKPASSATCAALSAKRTSSTSSTAPVSRGPAPLALPTVKGWALSPEAAVQLVTSSAAVPTGVPHDPGAGAIGAGSPST